jgi:hypothetical protein
MTAHGFIRCPFCASAVGSMQWRRLKIARLDKFQRKLMALPGDATLDGEAEHG